MNVGYVRLSRDDDRRNYVSIENQMLIIRQYAAEKHMVIDRWYEDDGVSGYVFDRPGFRRLMEDLDQDIDTVLVKDFSRLGRHNAKVLLLLDEFRERGKRLIVIDDAYDSFHSDDDTIGIKTWYNERYVKDTSKKIRRALGARQKEGTLITQPPFGYKRNEKDKAVIEIVSREAEYVRLVYDLYLKGFGYRKIAAYLTEKHVPTPSMARHARELEESRYTKRQVASEWSDGMVKEMLDNDFYVGTFRLHKRERVTIHGKDKRVPKEEQCIFEKHHPAIIDKMTFDLVQEVKAKRIRNHYRGSRGPWPESKIPNPFGNCLFCSDCGSRLTPVRRKTTSGERKYYICSAYNTKGKRYCEKAHLIEENDLMEDLVTYIKLCRNALCEEIAAYDLDAFGVKKQSPEVKQQMLQGDLEEQKRRLKVLLSQKIRDLSVVPDNEAAIRESYDDLQSDILLRIRRLELQLKELNEASLETPDAKGKLHNALEALDKTIDKGILTHKDMEILIERIEVDENGFPVIVLKYGLCDFAGFNPAEEINGRENAIIRSVMRLLQEDSRGFTSAKYLSAKLTDAGYKKSRKSVLPYIGLMLEMGIVEPGDNSLKPYTIVKAPAEIEKLMEKFPTGPAI